MKQKTKKAAQKRFTFTGTGKVKHRHIGQAHFNGRNTGKEGRRKHHDNLVSPADSQRIVDLLPNHN